MPDARSILKTRIIQYTLLSFKVVDMVDRCLIVLVTPFIAP